MMLMTMLMNDAAECDDGDDADILCFLDVLVTDVVVGDDNDPEYADDDVIISSITAHHLICLNKLFRCRNALTVWHANDDYMQSFIAPS